MPTHIEKEYIGGAPHEEPCAAIGRTEDFARINQIECRAYIAALKKVLGEPPEGCTFRVSANRHDFGTYYEVTLHYPVDDVLGISAEVAAYVRKAENGLARWGDADFFPPCLYIDHQAQGVVTDVELLDRTLNPKAHPTRERFEEWRASEAATA